MTEYQAVWKLVSKIHSQDLQQAYEHYMKLAGPDTFSLIAAQCIKAVQVQRDRDLGKLSVKEELG